MENPIIINNCEYRNQWWSEAWLLGVFLWWSKFLFLEAFEKEVSQLETRGIMGWEESRFCCVFTQKHLAAGLCEFCQLNKIRESQGEDNQAFVVVFSYKKICLWGCVSFTTLHKNWEWRGEKWSCWVVFVHEHFLCRMWISFTTWTKIRKQWDEEGEAIRWFLYKIICLQDVNFFHNLNKNSKTMRWGEWSHWMIFVQDHLSAGREFLSQFEHWEWCAEESEVLGIF
jgi:hypothetical protein